VLEHITSRQNELVATIAKLAEDTTHRRDTGLCLLEGVKLTKEAVRQGYQLRYLLVTDEAWQRDPDLFASYQANRTVMITKAVLNRITRQPSPDGVISVIPIRDIQVDICSAKRVILLSGVQDPANVGAVIRTAAALGYEIVLTDTDCADAYSPKSLRASMGASLAICPHRCDNLSGEIRRLRAAGLLVVAGVPGEDSRDLNELEPQPQMTLLIGNEGHGLPAQLLQQCDIAAHIPVTGRVESLNAASAATILMWHFRQR